MTGFSLSLGLLAVATIAVAASIARRPDAGATVGGKVLVFLALFVLPGLVLIGAASRHYEQAKTTQFCISCHAIDPFAESLLIDDPRFLPAAHYQNKRIPAERACYTCHSDYTMFGDFDDKVRGVRHVWHNFFRTASDPVELYRPFPNTACLRCHDGARSYEEEAEHAQLLADLRIGKKSCVMCHNLVHEVEKLDRFPRWRREGPQ